MSSMLNLVVSMIHPFWRRLEFAMIVMKDKRENVVVYFMGIVRILIIFEWVNDELLFRKTVNSLRIV